MNKINILVVDDRPEGLLAVEAVLNSPQYNLITANSGLDALKRLLEYDFAIILLDVQMPSMNGFETAAIIKTREKSKDIPIIFMSAINQDEHYVYQGYNAGAVDYLLKPFDPYILKSKVAIFADLHRLNKKIKEQAQRLHENDIKIYTQALDKLELESLRKYQYLADAIPQIVFRLFPNGSFNYFNKVWYAYTGLDETSLEGFEWQDAIHLEDISSLLTFFTGDDVGTREVECRIRNKEGHYRWHLIRIEPEIYVDHEMVKNWLGTATDIQERKTNEEFQRFLSDAGELLVSSLDFESNLKALSDMAVPRIADRVFFDLVHEEEGTVNLACELEKGPGITDKETKDSGDSTILGSDYSFITVALCSQGKAIGTMRLEVCDNDRKYDEKHLHFAKELGRRISMAYENSKLYRQAQDAIEIRNNFLSIASHELNTPVTSLKLQLQMLLKALQQLKSESLPVDRFEKSVVSSVNQVNRLIGLIQVLLDVSIIQSGKFNFTFSDFLLKDVIDETTERYNEILSNSDCHLIVSDISDVFVHWDKTRIEQVITNLIMNAIKYAPGKIELKALQEDGCIKIQVIDYGEGIAPEKIKTIFNRFERASTSGTIGGLGLGLFIVKEIIEGHHGRIEVSSEAGKGSCFTVSLPCNAEVTTYEKDLLKMHEGLPIHH